MSKFTPGPWTHRNGRIFQTDHERLTIANVGRAFDGDYSPANGDLLADAPALLDALESMCMMWHTVCDSFGWDADHMQQHVDARALIAKHRGGV